MRLADFIRHNMDSIVSNWEDFAATQMPAAAYMSRLELRDHAVQILEAIVQDLSKPQTKKEQLEKSLGQVPALQDGGETAAQTHAVLRARSDFNINQLAAEYRALRASVLRLWMTDHVPSANDVDEIIRFNEAIDQALVESIDYFSCQVEQSRNLLLGMIGHDLRNPLQAILLTSQHLSALNAGEAVSKAASRLINSGSRIQALLDDLVAFNRTRLGLGLHIRPSRVDLKEVVEDELDQFRAAYPDRQLTLESTGDTRGCWDRQRLHQLLGNLLSNAIKHGTAGKPVQVLIFGAKSDVRLEVRNVGPSIDPSVLRRMFSPLAAGSDQKLAGDHSLGLGLFIAREITAAHGGDIRAQSEGEITTFAVNLPRREEANVGADGQSPKQTATPSDSESA